MSNEDETCSKKQWIIANNRRAALVMQRFHKGLSVEEAKELENLSAFVRRHKRKFVSFQNFKNGRGT